MSQIPPLKKFKAKLLFNFKYYKGLLVLLLLVILRSFFVCSNFIADKECFLDSDYKAEQASFAFAEKIQKKASEKMTELYPSPHSELLLGMIFGFDDLKSFPKFKEALKITGTIHVVVVSGFNVTLLYSYLLKVFGSKYKIRNLLLSQGILLFYCVISGFQPPVIRAWFMTLTLGIGKFYGRTIDVFRVLLFSALIMLMFNPAYLVSLSFQLSFLATLGLLCFGNHLSNLFSNYFEDLVFLEDLSATISAQVFVLPLISYVFGSVSVISFFVNTLILWTVPIATILGTVSFFTYLIHPVLGKIVGFFVYPFADLFIQLVFVFSRFSFSSIDFQVSGAVLGVWYFLVFVLLRFLKKKDEIS